MSSILGFRAILLLAVIFVTGTTSLQAGITSTNKLDPPGPYNCLYPMPDQIYCDDAGAGYGELFGPPLVVDTIGDTTVDLWMENLSDSVTIEFKITVSYINGSDWIIVSPQSGSIPPLTGGYFASFTFSAPAGAPDPSYWFANIEITYNGPYSQRVIPICLQVCSFCTFLPYADLTTPCKKLRIYNDGGMSKAHDNLAFDYIDDCDTFNLETQSSIYLYGGSPLVAYEDDPGNPHVFRSVYGASYPDSNAWYSMNDLEINDFSPYYTLTTNRMITSDYRLIMQVAYYVPKGVTECEFIIQGLKIYAADSPINNVYLGEFLDWDVPSDTLMYNSSGYDASRSLIYQAGVEYDLDDSTEALCPQESNQRFAGIAIKAGCTFRNALTIDGPTYVYMTGPFQDEAPLPSDTILGLMRDGYGYMLYEDRVPAPPAESLYTDIGTLVTFGNYDLLPGDTICMTNILATTKTGLADLQAAIDAGNDFIIEHGIGCDCPVVCDCVPGEANNDGGINIGDAVYLVNYIFKGGPAPQPYATCSGDANGDCECNMGDVIYLINRLFHFGEPPIDCLDFLNRCGSLY